MNLLSLDIAANFGEGCQPRSSALVLSDGFDQLDKHSAVQFYGGKTWSDVLEHLRSLGDEPVFGAAYYLEEWSVLSKEALPYYLRAHLEFMIETLSSPQPDEDFLSLFFHQLYQVIFMHKGSPFNTVQTVLLQRIASSVAENANDHYVEPEVLRFLAELRTHDS